ncbi:MAG: nucleotidyltransferase domain-containing protein [bacterium]
MIPSSPFADLAKRLAEVSGRFPEVLAAYLFGSMAEGRAGPHSDLDLAVVPTSPAARGRRVDILAALVRGRTRRCAPRYPRRGASPSWNSASRSKAEISRAPSRARLQTLDWMIGFRNVLVHDYLEVYRCLAHRVYHTRPGTAPQAQAGAGSVPGTRAGRRRDRPIRWGFR